MRIGKSITVVMAFLAVAGLTPWTIALAIAQNVPPSRERSQEVENQINENIKQAYIREQSQRLMIDQANLPDRVQGPVYEDQALNPFPGSESPLSLTRSKSADDEAYGSLSANDLEGPQAGPQKRVDLMQNIYQQRAELQAEEVEAANLNAAYTSLAAQKNNGRVPQSVGQDGPLEIPGQPRRAYCMEFRQPF